MPFGIAAERIQENAPFNGNHDGFQRYDERSVDFEKVERRADGYYIIQWRICYDACEGYRNDFIAASIAKKPCCGSFY